MQIRSGHTVTYDVEAEDAVRALHVAGTLRFTRDNSTRLNVGLLKVSPGAECDEDGFNCHDMAGAPLTAEDEAALDAGFNPWKTRRDMALLRERDGN